MREGRREGGRQGGIWREGAIQPARPTPSPSIMFSGGYHLSLAKIDTFYYRKVTTSKIIKMTLKLMYFTNK